MWTWLMRCAIDDSRQRNHQQPASFSISGTINKITGEIMKSSESERIANHVDVTGYLNNEVAASTAAFSVSPSPTLGLERPNGMYVQIVKPFIDIFCASLLCIFLLPIGICIAIIIKLESKGPVFFKQQRYGKDGVIFNIIKFRTMYANVANQGRSPMSGNDPRITRVGRVLRKTSLDEIPQIINILHGDMSFIGPRPEQRSIVEQHYTNVENHRLLVSPGITGLWQISLDRKASIHENLHHDFKYIREVSLLLDLEIVWRTIVVMFKSNTY